MKKTILALTLCVVMIASIAVFAACSSSLVNVSGNYKETTAAEVEQKLQNVDTVISSNFQVKMSVKVNVPASGTTQAISGEAVLDVIYAVENGVVKMSGTIKSTGGPEGAVEGSVYTDGEYAYIDDGTNKVKEPVSSAGLGTEFLPHGDIMDMLKSNAVTLSVAESGNTLKIKASDPSNEHNVMYIVIKDNKVDGVVMNTMRDEYLTISLEMQATTKTPVAPSDLDSYVSAM